MGTELTVSVARFFVVRGPLARQPHHEEPPSNRSNVHQIGIRGPVGKPCRASGLMKNPPHTPRRPRARATAVRFMLGSCLELQRGPRALPFSREGRRGEPERHVLAERSLLCAGMSGHLPGSAFSMHFNVIDTVCVVGTGQVVGSSRGPMSFNGSWMPGQARARRRMALHPLSAIWRLGGETLPGLSSS